ncbi:MAG: toll/interleukin-1 receptor domain-containing protein [Hyphomonadaceae bacterium]
MSIFLSYKRENQDAVERIVRGLRGAGLAVWWDQDIAPDAPWEQTIEGELTKAKVVIVAWSQAAVGSENVKAEARRARNQGKLIQVYVEPCEPPLFFGERQGVDLSTWSGNPGDNRFQAILTAVQAIFASKRPPEGVGYRSAKRTPWGVLTALFVAVSAALGFVSNLGGARNAVCAIAAINETCVQYGLIAPMVDPAVARAEARERLMQRLTGTWGRMDRDCADSVVFAVTLGEDEVYRVRRTAPGLDSIEQVSTIDTDNDVVTARETLPGEDGRREQWEYRPNGAVLALRDAAGTETTLARCE